jgi:hypothetical protein
MLTEGLPPNPVDEPEVWFLYLLCLTVCLNLYYLLTSESSDNFIALYLKRKSLEEKNKIKKLTEL